MEKVYVKAEDFRDKAWGIYPIDDDVDLVLEMTHGYSDLYFAKKGEREAMMEEIFFEEPGRERINEYCRKNFGVEFVWKKSSWWLYFFLC